MPCHRFAFVHWFLRRAAAALLLAGGVRLSGFGSPPADTADTAAVQALIRRGEALQSREPAAALAVLRQAHAQAEQLGFKAGYFRSMQELTFALSGVGQYAEAKALARRALALAEQDTSRQARGLCHFSLGVTAARQGDYPEAVRQYHAAEHYLAQLHQVDNLNMVYNNLAMIYQQQRLYGRAVQELRRVLQIQRKTKADRRGFVFTYFNIGTNYWRQYLASPAQRGSKDSAKHYFGLARRLFDPEQDRDLLVTNYDNQGEVFLREAREAPAAGRRALYDSSFHYYNKALRLSRQQHNPVSELHELAALATIYNDQRRYALARPLLAQALAMVRRHGNAPEERKAIYRELINLHEGQRNYAAAYGWRDRYEAVADSLDNQATKDLLESYQLRARQADAQLKLHAKQTQINRLQAERERLGLLAVAALAGAALLLLGLLYYRQRQRTHAQALLALQRGQELLAARAEVQGQQKERVRIAKEMHDDMGASLTVIGLLSEVMKTRPETAAAPEVEKISALSADLVATMNEVIWSLNPRNDSLNGLIAYVRAYAREFLDNTDLRLRIEAAEAAADVRIGGDERRHVFLAVKEALHNVVKHAGARRVTLRLQAREGALRIEVCDDGRGLGADAVAPRPGGRHGLANMAQRLRQAGGSCRVRARPEGGTCVELHFPYPPASAQAAPAGPPSRPAPADSPAEILQL